MSAILNFPTLITTVVCKRLDLFFRKQALKYLGVKAIMSTTYSQRVQGGGEMERERDRDREKESEREREERKQMHQILR